MRVSITTNNFEKDILNIANYSLGFIEGAQRGKKVFLDNLGRGVIFALGQYIDVEARANSSTLHHVYEWYRTGSPEARLFDLNYTVSNLGLSLGATFKQSKTIQADSNTPFYNKARIMENGIPVVIKPKKNSVLKFYSGGETIFTSKPITVRDPGGVEVEGSFERVFDEFMKRYFTQAFLRASGVSGYISNPVIYKTNLKAGAKQGRQKGLSTGYKWITNAKIEVE
jgi:hypothetical protein